MQPERVATRFHLDSAAWFHTTEKAEHLKTIARAVWEERILRMRYRRSGETVSREVQPLGLVLKSGLWYLIAQRGGQTLTYRAINVVEAEILDQPFERPADFNLPSYWTQAARSYERGLFSRNRRNPHVPSGPRNIARFRCAGT